MINSLLGFVLVSSNRSKSDPTGGGFVPLNTHLDTHVSNFFADFESSSALATESFTGLETVGDGDNGSSIVENSTAEARTLDNRCDGAAFKAVVSIAFALLVIRLLLRPSILSTLIKQTRKRSLNMGPPPPAGEEKVVLLKAVGGEIGSASALAPKLGPLGLVSLYLLFLEAIC